MALGFTSHYRNSDQPFGTLILSNIESETAGSVARGNSSSGGMNIFSGGAYDSCEFSVSVNIDYSQYANIVSTSGSAETAGSVAYYSGGGVSTASTVTSFSGGGFSGGGGCSAASYTC